MAALPADDHRRTDPKFQEPQLTANLTLVDALSEIAANRGMSVNKLVAEIDRNRAPDTANLSSAIRVYILTEIQGRRETSASPEARISSVGL